MNIENYNVIELSDLECQSINGGSWLSYALGWVAGQVANAAEAYATVVQEGGKTCTDMPFK